MNKYVVTFVDKTPNEVVEADYYTWFGNDPITFINKAGCEHEPAEYVARFATVLVRSVRLAE